MTGPTKFPAPRCAELKRKEHRRGASVAAYEGKWNADHKARQREAEWRAYQALWQAPIDKLVCTAEAFYALRRNVLHLNRKQTARLLRVGVNSVFNWETGVHPVPFYAFLALLLVSESQHYKLANFAWRDWAFIERAADTAFAKKNQKYVNELVCYKTGASFTPEQLNHIHWQTQRLAALDGEAIALRGKVDALAAENNSLREMFRDDGVTNELHDVRERVEKLLTRINTASVIPLARKSAA